MPSVMAVMNLATLHRTAPTRFLPQEHHGTKTYLIQGIDTPTTEGTDHTPIMVQDIGDISTGHSPTTIPTMREAAAIEGTPHGPLSAIAAACATLWPMDASITTTHHDTMYCPLSLNLLLFLLWNLLCVPLVSTSEIYISPVETIGFARAIILEVI